MYVHQVNENSALQNDCMIKNISFYIICLFCSIFLSADSVYAGNDVDYSAHFRSLGSEKKLDNMLTKLKCKISGKYAVRTLSSEEIDSIRDYTSWSTHYNQYMRTGKTIGGYSPESLTRKVIKVDESLSKIRSSYKGDVYRISKAEQGVFGEKIKVGDTIGDRGFWSTSGTNDIFFDDDFKGAPGIWSGEPTVKDEVRYKVVSSEGGKNISTISEFPEQNEILFQPNSRFEVLAIEDKPGYKGVILKEAAARDTNRVVKNPFNGEGLDLSEPSPYLKPAGVCR